MQKDPKGVLVVVMHLTLMLLILVVDLVVVVLEVLLQIIALLLHRDLRHPLEEHILP